MDTTSPGIASADASPALSARAAPASAARGSGSSPAHAHAHAHAHLKSHAHMRATAAAAADSVRKMRACNNCARLKMKCRWPDGVGTPDACIRCARMRISCAVPMPTQRKKRGKSTRVAQLEQKIDGIVSLLTASQQLQQQQQQQQHSPSAPPPLPAAPPSVSVPSPASLTPEAQILPLEAAARGPGKDRSPPRNAVSALLVGPAPGQLASPHAHAHAHAHAHTHAAPRPDGSVAEVVPGFDMTFARADELLDVYRAQFAPAFPFVQVGRHTSSYMLHAARPFLFWTLMHVTAAQTPAIQLAMKEWFHRSVAERVVVRGERSLELLQALVVYLGWSDLHLYIEHQATALLHLATSLVSDLNLNRVPGSVGAAPNTLLGDAWLASHRQAAPRLHHSYDEMRATLGVFFTASLNSSLFKRNHDFHFTPYLAQCLDVLARKPDSDLDAALAATVRIQRMADRIYTVLPNAEVDDGAGVFRAPVDLAVNSIRRELDGLYAGFPEGVRSSALILPHYTIISARLYEPVINMAAPSMATTAMSSAAPFRRAEMLWTCLHRIKDFCSAWFAIPLETFAVCPFATSSYMMFCLILGTKLLLGESAGDWDSAMARAQLDFADMIQRVSDRFEEADRLVLQRGLRRRYLADGSPAVLKYTFKFRWLKQWYYTRTQQEARPGMDMSAMADALQMEFGFDEEFWRAVMLSDGMQAPAERAL